MKIRGIFLMLKDKDHHRHNNHKKSEDSLPTSSKRCPCTWLFWWVMVGIALLLFVRYAFGNDVLLKSFRFTKPKPIIQSNKTLNSTIQSAIENLAKQEIQQEQAKATLAVAAGQVGTTTTTSDSGQTNEGLATPLLEVLQETFTTSPAYRAKVRLRKIDRLAQELMPILITDKSDQTVSRVVNVVKKIGNETQKIVSDKGVQTDREILTRQIAQYNRIQLILQKLEDTLPMKQYLVIEDARVKYLVRGAQESINAAPNLNVIHNIAIKEIEKHVGPDFAQLKALEVLSDIGSGLSAPAQKKLAGLKKELALEFERHMLKLPHEVRTRRLQEYMTLSYGNPIRQVQAFDTMKAVMSDRDLILEMEGLKEFALSKLEKRVFELDNEMLLNRFFDEELSQPEDLKILTQLTLHVLATGDEKSKQQMANIEKNSQAKLITRFGHNEKALASLFAEEEGKTADLLNIVEINNLEQLLSSSPLVSQEVIATLKSTKAAAIKSFLDKVSTRGFTTAVRKGYNPVDQNADVRVLLPNPYTIQLLSDLQNDLTPAQRSILAQAQRAENKLVEEHILEHVTDPQIFKGYQKIITENPVVKSALQTYGNRVFFSVMAQKQKIIEKIAHGQDQALYEKMQQITQEIFITHNKSGLEQQLSTEVQQLITDLKQELADKNIPRLETPADVTLPQVATLPTTIQNAIIEAAREKISEADQVKLNLEEQAKDLEVPIPQILPDNPLYSLVEAARVIALVTKADPVDRAEELLKQDNEKILEAAKLVETNPSAEATNTAIDTLQSVAADFDTLKDHIGELTAVQKTEPQKVQELVDTMIDDGLSRQTVISQIENVVHGEDYVKVEKLRTDMVKDGIDLLLEVTDNNVEKLTQKLEETVKSEQNNPLEGIKAVELLNEIARTQPEDIQQILQTSETTIAQIVETKILAIPEEGRTQEVLDYAAHQTGSPVRQLEAYDILKDSFDNPDTILLTEGLKDKATENLIERISEISDETTRVEFADSIIGELPQDLKAIIEVEARVEPPQNAGAVETLPIAGQVEDIKAVIEQNIIDTYKDKPQELAATDFYDNPTLSTTPDAADVQVAQELTQVMEQTPEVSKEVVALAQKEEAKIIDTFIENISKAQVEAQTSAETTVSAVVAKTLDPLPDTLIVLVELKEELPAADQAKIDIAIEAQVNLIQDHLVNTVTDLATFQALIAQIEENSVVKAVVTQVGSTEFTQAVEMKAQEVATVAAQQETTLQTTVTQVQQEIFSTTSTTSSVEQSLPADIQQQVETIKQEVPVEQIPQVSVQAAVAESTSVTVTTPVETQPVQAPAVAPEPAAAPAAPPPEAPVVQPAPEAPAVPGL
ncbi:hypothetical protein HY214_03420 [Candidatus Roizmanbacteria bacterium]|nr:hypothetical protein [Candidatus Roizmanbacteria bacterium]